MNDLIVYGDFGARPVRRVAGERALAFLHDVLTADIASLQPSSGVVAAYLTDKGRIRAIIRVIALAGGDALIDADPAAEPALEWLARIAPLAGVDLIPEQRRLIAVVGDPAVLGATPGDALHDHVSLGDDAVVVRTEYGADVLDAGSRAVAGLEAAGARADIERVRAARISAANLVYGVDVDDTTLVNETPLAGAGVSYTKGCYPGQESVARIKNLGQLRRRLAVLAVAAPPPAPGTRVDPDAGDISSAAAAGSGSVAFAMLRVEAIDAGELTVGGAPAEILRL